ncbi:MAG TPA: flagellar export chaperone FlgN, partial [Gemmatimonadaceae bacterium]|nr:flagellar export chaperone FlgN [Gemmatimonadaceae bacterium]
EEIIAIMRRQRTAVSADDLQAVDDSVFATHRVLVTLNEARRRRRAINVLFGEREDLPITQLDAVLGAKMTSQLSEAREALHATARKLSREVAMNRGILRQALASGDAYARVLTGAQADPVYTAGQAPRRAGGANLFDRRI